MPVLNYVLKIYIKKQIAGHVYAVPDNMVTLDTLQRRRVSELGTLYHQEVGTLYPPEDNAHRVSDYEPTDSGFTEEYSDLTSSDRLIICTI